VGERVVRVTAADVRVYPGEPDLADFLALDRPAGSLRISLVFLVLGSAGEDMVVDYAEALGLISPKYCELMHMPFRKLFAPLPPAASLPPPVPSGHDTNNFCSWGTVHNLIIIGAVIPLLEASSGQ
jgi:hypothetical protein